MKLERLLATKAEYRISSRISMRILLHKLLRVNVGLLHFVRSSDNYNSVIKLCIEREREIKREREERRRKRKECARGKNKNSL